jgi:uncharacterized MAPEG superfamily protein
MYNYLYIMSDTRQMARFRSIVWGMSMWLIMTLFVKSARFGPVGRVLG